MTGLALTPVADRRPRAFQIRTCEGSTFVARFDPEQESAGVLFGRLQILGRSQRTGRSIRVVGIGCLPEPGGGIVVSQEPAELHHALGDAVPSYPQETIATVTELPLPGI